MKKINLREKKGITVIALVITIIVMLILTTVTINLSLNGNLFEYARKSNLEYDSAKEKELIEQAKMMAMMERKSAKTAKDDIENALDELVGEENYTSNQTENGLEITFVGSGRTYVLEYNEQLQPEYFYVYKTGDCSVERVLITGDIENNGYNIVNKVSSDKYYGGYYSEYGGTETDVTSLAYVNNKATDENGESYDGSAIKSSNNVNFWKKANAYSQAGNQMQPEAGKVYYLCEIPKTYLTLKYVLIASSNNSNVIATISIVSVIDSANYQTQDIEITGTTVNDIPATLAPRYSTAGVNSSISSIRPQDYSGVTRGYVVVKGEFLSSVEPDVQFTATPYWITVDGIRVNGPSKTYNTGNNGSNQCTFDTFHEVTN